MVLVRGLVGSIVSGLPMANFVMDGNEWKDWLASSKFDQRAIYLVGRTLFVTTKADFYLVVNSSEDHLNIFLRDRCNMWSRASTHKASAQNERVTNTRSNQCTSR